MCMQLAWKTEKWNFPKNCTKRHTAQICSSTTLKPAYQYAILFYFASLIAFSTKLYRQFSAHSHSTFWALTRKSLHHMAGLCVFLEEPFNSSISSTLYTFPVVVLKKNWQYIFIKRAYANAMAKFTRKKNWFSKFTVKFFSLSIYYTLFEIKT